MSKSHKFDKKYVEKTIKEIKTASKNFELYNVLGYAKDLRDYCTKHKQPIPEEELKKIEKSAYEAHIRFLFYDVRNLCNFVPFISAPEKLDDNYNRAKRVQNEAKESGIDVSLDEFEKLKMKYIKHLKENQNFLKELDDKLYNKQYYVMDPDDNVKVLSDKPSDLYDKNVYVRIVSKKPKTLSEKALNLIDFFDDDPRKIPLPSDPIGDFKALQKIFVEAESNQKNPKK